ncbi:hypothetical protein C1H46_024038 [Malus baccata]|uniref:superoxide dismutase n=1 Tax=Malus baccata TaxID=106549 RepID=A0A540LV79_MALBA|nr:hypothetical protein C1H46_024038 [Malus baccata]
MATSLQLTTDFSKPTIHLKPSLEFATTPRRFRTSLSIPRASSSSSDSSLVSRRHFVSETAALSLSLTTLPLFGSVLPAKAEDPALSEQTLLETKDGGETWVQRSIPSAEDEDFNYRFNAISFKGKEGWIVGKPAILLHTSDSGDSWERIPLSSQLPGDMLTEDFEEVPVQSRGFGILDVGYRSKDEAWAAGGSGILLQTTNGGKTWTRDKAADNIAANLYSVKFIDDKKGFVLGNDGVLLRFPDRLFPKGLVQFQTGLRLTNLKSSLGHSMKKCCKQVWNHDFFWESMQPGGGEMPQLGVLQQIEKDFGSFSNFREKFTEAALTLFGSGWVWLVLKREERRLQIIKTSNAICPIVWDDIPIISLDLWEHAYYLDFKNDRGKYVDTFMNHLVSWNAAMARMARAEAFVNLNEPNIPVA